MRVSASPLALAATGTLAVLGPALTPAQMEEPVTAVWVELTSPALRNSEALRDLVVRSQTGVAESQLLDPIAPEALGAAIDTVIPVVRGSGTTRFESSHEPMASTLGGDLADPLQALIDLAADNPIVNQDLAVWAAVDVLPVHRGGLIPPRGHVTQEHPEWRMVDTEGDWEIDESEGTAIYLDPGIDGVRAHVADVVRELVREYNFEALVLDGLRYPEGGTSYGYSEDALAAFHLAVGEIGVPHQRDETWRSWRRAQVTETLRGIVEVVRLERPDLPIWVTAEAVGDISGGFEGSGTHDEQMQDWPRWVEEGLVDGIILKNFRDDGDEEDAQAFRAWTRFAQETSEGQVGLVVGFSGALNYRNDLFRQVRGVAANQGTRDAGIAFWTHDTPALDAGDDFYMDVHHALDGLRVAVPASDAMPVDDDTAMDDAPMDDGPMDDSDLFASPDMESDEAMDAPVDDADLFGAPEPDGGDTVVEVMDEADEDDVSTRLPMPGDVSAVVEVMDDAPVDDTQMDVPPPLDDPLAGEPDLFDMPGDPVRPALPSLGLPEDVITLEGGRTLAGEIVEEYDHLVTIRMQGGTVVRVPRDQVVSIERGGL